MKEKVREREIEKKGSECKVIIASWRIWQWYYDWRVGNTNHAVKPKSHEREYQDLWCSSDADLDNRKEGMHVRQILLCKKLAGQECNKCLGLTARMFW